MRVSGVCVGAFVFTRALVVQAEPNVAVAVDYAAHPDCPSSADFLGEVTSRTSRVHAAKTDEAALPLRVRIERVAGGSRGEIVLGSGDDAARRQVSAQDCGQVVAALALMTALAIDPDAVTSPEPPRPPPAPPPPAPAHPPQPRREARAPVPADPMRTAFHAGAALELGNAIAVDPTPAPRVFVGLERATHTAGYGARLGVGRAEARVSNATGAGELVLTSGRLDACFLQALLGTTLWAVVCGALEGGSLRATGREVTPRATVTRPWFEAGADARLEGRLLRSWCLELAGGLMLPLVRDRFFVQGDATVRRTPPVTVAVSLGSSVRF